MARTPAPGTRERILDGAAELFYERGIRAVGMAQIIDTVGCGKNLLYGHFPSKSDLVAEYLTRFRQTRAESVEKALRRAGDDPADQLVALTAEVADRVARPGNRGCALRNYLTEFPDGDDRPGQVAQAFLHDSRARVDRLAAALPVADPQRLADRIWLVLEGLYASARNPRRGHAGPVAVEFVRELLTQALATGAPTPDR